MNHTTSFANATLKCGGLNMVRCVERDCEQSIANTDCYYTLLLCVTKRRTRLTM